MPASTVPISNQATEKKIFKTTTLKNNLSQIRREYAQRSLSRKEVSDDPLKQLQLWLDEAIRAEVMEPTAMILSTAESRGRPSARTVLLKGLTQQGLVFYTNYNSRKGQHLTINPFASTVFFWPELERQIRLEGRVEKVSAGESDRYFNSRPALSRLGAWASPQSRVIPDRSLLEKKLEQIRQQYGEEDIPRPPHWGGYLLLPDRVEFWQGRRSRLHDRIEYTQTANTWKIQRLAP